MHAHQQVLHSNVPMRRQSQKCLSQSASIPQSQQDGWKFMQMLCWQAARIYVWTQLQDWVAASASMLAADQVGQLGS